MHALTLHQPWASLIAARIKTIETRSWPAYHDAIGKTIAIHAGKTVHQRLPASVMLAKILEIWGDNWIKKMPRGAVVAFATLTHVEQVKRWADVPHAQTPYGDFSPHRWMWHFTDITPLAEPIPCRGYQGFWDWPEGDRISGDLKNADAEKIAGATSLH